MDPNHELAGRTAVVTGAAGGLGRVTAVRLAQAGATVVCADLAGSKLPETVAAVEKAGGTAYQVEFDQRDPRLVTRMADQTAELAGSVDILVNNAAVYKAQPWHEISIEDWDRTMETNVRGYFLCALALRDSLRRSPAGRIVNLASLTFFVGFPELLDYVASKGAIVGFTRTLARELGPDGVTVNAVSPGAIPTAAEAIHADPEAYSAGVLEKQALKRRGRPEDVADLVVFLASERAGFITGQTIGVDGGWVTH